LFDYSRTLLADAVAHWGHDQRFVFVAGNLYDLPLASGVLDSLVMVRVMHHLADVAAALAQLTRVLHGQSVAVLEYANKRNLKAIARWLLRQQRWSPFALEPIEFVALNFDFHPQWMAAQLGATPLSVQQQFAVSNFRLPFLKQRVNAQQLAKWDQYLFQLGGRFPLSPSVFLQGIMQSDRLRSAVSTAPDSITALFRCPHCAAEAFSAIEPSQIQCGVCQRIYAQQGGVWDFKESLM
jgi:SAM-dependent methyltransferase